MPVNTAAILKLIGDRKVGEVAEAAQITRANLSAIIHGRQDNPTIGTLERLAKTLGVSVTRLIAKE